MSYKLFVADMVTIANNNEDAVAEAIEGILLN